MFNRHLLQSVVVTLGLALGAAAQAQTWPVKPVRVIVPFVPGGTADTLGRLTAARLTEIGRAHV